MPVPSPDNTIVGKIGNVYCVPYGTAAPFTIPPPGSLDITALSLPAAWSAGNLGYLHEDDTPDFAFPKETTRLSAWQLNGQTLRTVHHGKLRSVGFTAREWNRTTWGLVEPGTVYTTGVNGTTSLSVPAVNTDSPKAWLFDLQDLDNGMKVWWYVPKGSVTQIGSLKADRKNTLNIVLTVEFEQDGSNTNLYYIVGNHDGFAA